MHFPSLPSGTVSRSAALKNPLASVPTAQTLLSGLIVSTRSTAGKKDVYTRLETAYSRSGVYCLGMALALAIPSSKIWARKHFTFERCAISRCRCKPNVAVPSLHARWLWGNRTACQVFTLHLGFVHPLQDVALHQCLPLLSVCCFPVPGGSLLLLCNNNNNNNERISRALFHVKHAQLR